MKLHLGCGKRNFGGEWIHIDGGDYPHLHSHDITKLPFEDGSADVIYASHLISYFNREEIIPILKEWRRVLGYKGLLRIAIPNFNALAKLYTENGFDLMYLLGPLYGQMQMNGSPIYHKTIYDPYHLSRVLLKAGFTNVRHYDWSKTDHSWFDDQSQAYLPDMNKKDGTLISLNFECEKNDSYDNL